MPQDLRLRKIDFDRPGVNVDAVVTPPPKIEAEGSVIIVHYEDDSKKANERLSATPPRRPDFGEGGHRIAGNMSQAYAQDMSQAYYAQPIAFHKNDDNDNDTIPVHPVYQSKSLLSMILPDFRFRRIRFWTPSCLKVPGSHARKMSSSQGSASSGSPLRTEDTYVNDISKSSIS
jgi:hypothetical protein